MAVALPPIDEQSYDAHADASFQRSVAATQADLADVRRRHEEADAQAGADFAADARAQLDATLAPYRDAQEGASFTQQAQAQTRALTRNLPAPQTASGARAPLPGRPAGGAASGLGRVYQDARDAGLDDAGARAAVAVAATEGGMTGSIGDTDQNPLGSAGTFQLNFGGGQGNAYARSRGISDQQAQQELAADPHAGNRYALSGYLGQAIKAGQAQGLRGADLATYAQHYGQRSVSPERAGASYNALQGQSFDQTPPGSVPGAPPSPGAEKAQYAMARAPTRAQAVGQFEQGLDYAEAAAICGPVAALAFVQANGRNPSLAEVRALAVKRGWTAAGGMNGVANEQALLADLGVRSRLDTSPDFGQVAADAGSGNPVIISTPVHYYYANAADPATGRIFVGKTGTSRRGGGSWMTPQQIADLDGGINGVLYVDNPQSPTPSVATASGDTSGERPPSEFAPPSPFAPQGFDPSRGRYMGPEVTAPIAPTPAPAPMSSDEAPWTPPPQVGPEDVGATGLPRMRPEYRRISGLDGGPSPLDIPALVDVPNRVGFQAAEALATGQDPGAALVAMGTAGGHQARSADLLAAAGVPDGPTRVAAGKILDAALDYTNVLPGLTLSRDAGLVRQLVVEPLGAVIGSEAAGTVGELVGGERGRAIGELVGGVAGAGALGARYRAIEADPRAQRLGIVAGGGEGADLGDVPAAARAGDAEVARLRLDKAPAEARAVLARAAERGDYWLQQRRNVISDAEAERMADELGRSADEMIAGGRIGRAYNTEELRALKNGLVGQGLKVDDLTATVEALGDQASDALRRELGQEEATLLALSRIVEGGRAEAGRAFRAFLGDSRNRLLRARGPQYTNVSRVPIAAAPELGAGAAQGTLVDPLAHYPPLQDVPAQPRAPGSATPALTEQPPLITEPVSRTGRATDLTGATRTVGSGPTAYDRASLVRVAGMLSGVPTHLVNILGNTVQGGLTVGLKEGQIAADLARVGIGKVLGRDVQRQRFQAEVGPQLAGYGRGFWAGLQQVPGILAHGAPQSFHDVHGTRGLASGSAIVDAAVEMPMRALAASDATFRTAAFGGHAAALATRQATREGLSGAARTRRAREILGNLSDYPVLLDNANNLAARDVFGESRAVTTAIAQFKREHTGARVAGDLVLPFYKSPYNVAAQGAGMTPAGLAGVLQSARRGETGEAVDRAVRATVGTLALGAGLQLAANNFLTGAYPADAATRSTLPEGWKPYAFRIPSGDGAVYVPIQTMGAVAVPFGVAAIMHDAYERGVDKNDLWKAAWTGLGGIGQYMADMSALQGLNSVTKLLTQPERSAEATAESFAASFVPASGLLRTVQQAFGDAQRDPDNALQAFMAGVPGLAGMVPEKQTPLGEVRSRGPAGPLALAIGSRVGVGVPDRVTAALRAAGVGVGDPPTTVSHPTAKAFADVPLTPWEQRRYRALAGEEIRRRVEADLDNPGWATADVARRAKRLRDAVDAARASAARTTLDRIGADEAKRRLAARPPRRDRPAA